MTIPLASSGHGVSFAIKVIPRAGRSMIAGIRGDALLVRLSAAPVDGAANDALLDLLADLFDRPRRDVSLLAGATSRSKRVAIAGLTVPQIEAVLTSALARA